MSNELTLAVRLQADGSDLVGEVRVSKDEIGKLGEQLDHSDKAARRASKGQEALGRSSGRAAGQAKHLNGTYKNLTRTLMGTVAAYASIRGAQELLSAYKQQEQAVAALDQSIASMGRTTTGLSQNLQALAAQIQQEGVIPDESIIQGQSFLTTYSDITDDLLPRTTLVMADVAAKMKGDVVSAANLVGKASMGMVGELSRIGITLSDTAKESKDFGLILTEIEQQLGGMNAAMGLTASGGITQFGMALDDLKEPLGQIITIGVSDYLRGMKNDFKLADETVRAWGETLKTAIGYLDDAAIAVGGLLVARTVGPALQAVAVGMVAMTRGSLAMNSALVVSAVQMRATAAAGTALKAALAFVGGPGGLALLAAGGLTYFATSASRASDDVERLREKTGALLGKMNELTRRQKESAIQEWEAVIETQRRSVLAVFTEARSFGRNSWDELLDYEKRRATELQDVLDDSIERMTALKKNLQDLDSAAGGTQSNETANRLGEVTDEAEAMSIALDLISKQFDELDEQEARQIAGLGGVAEALQAETEAQRELNKLLDEAIRQEEEMVRAYDARVQSNNELVRSLQEEYELLQLSDRERYIEVELRKLSVEATEDQRDAVRELAGSIYDAQEAARQLKKEADPVAEIYKQAARNIYDSFRDTFRDVLDHGVRSFKDLGDRLLSIFKDILAEMATLAIARPIIVPVVAGMGSLLGVSQTAQAGVVQQLGGMPGWLEGSGFLAGAGSFSGGAQAFLGMDTQAAMLAGQEVGLSGAATAGYYALPVLGGGLLGNALYGSNGGAIGGAVGGAVGAAVAGPIGAVIGSAVIGGIADALGIGGGGYKDAYGHLGSGSAVGSYDRKTMAHGAFGDIGWAAGTHHAGGEKKSPAAQKYFQALADLDNVIAQFLPEDEVDRVKEALDGWTSSAKHAFKSFEDMTKERLVVVFGAIDEGLGDIIDAFDGSTEELAAYAQAVAAAHQTQAKLIADIDRTVSVMQSADQAQAAYASSLADIDAAIADTQDALASTFDYPERVALAAKLNDQVRQRYQLEQQMLGAQLQAVRTLAAGVAGLRDSVQGAIASISGQADYRGPIDVLSDTHALRQRMAALNEYWNSQESYQDALLSSRGDVDQAITQLGQLRDETLRYYEAQRQLAEGLQAGADSIGDTLTRLRRGAMSPGAALADMQAEFDALMRQAGSASPQELAGIADQLNALAEPLLDQARGLYASGQNYQDLFAYVTGALEDVQQLMLDSVPNYEAESLMMLSSIDGALSDLDAQISLGDSLIVDAIAASEHATVFELQRIRALLEDAVDTSVKANGADGSHAGGLPRVPWDDYRANLHAGEAVIDAQTMAAFRRYGIPAGNAGANDGRLLAALERIEKAVQGSGDLHLRVVTPDGRVLKEETIREVGRRLRRRELVATV